MSEISPAVPVAGASAPVSLAIAGALVDLGAVTVTFVAAGAVVIVAAVAGIAWGVPTQMVWPDDD